MHMQDRTGTYNLTTLVTMFYVDSYMFRHAQSVYSSLEPREGAYFCRLTIIIFLAKDCQQQQCVAGSYQLATGNTGGSLLYQVVVEVLAVRGPPLHNSINYALERINSQNVCVGNSDLSFITTWKQRSLTLNGKTFI